MAKKKSPIFLHIEDTIYNFYLWVTPINVSRVKNAFDESTWIGLSVPWLVLILILSYIDQIITATSRNKDLIGNALLTWNRLFRHQQRLKSYSRTYINHRWESKIFSQSKEQHCYRGLSIRKQRWRNLNSYCWFWLVFYIDYIYLCTQSLLIWLIIYSNMLNMG